MQVKSEKLSSALSNMSASEKTGEQEPEDSQDGLQEAKSDPIAEQIMNLERRLDEERKRSAELSKRMQYLQADLQNLQKQSERKVLQAREDERIKYLLQLASIEEDLERALTVGSEEISRGIRDGLSMLLSRIDSDLRSESVERIGVKLGSEFDPKVHEAVAYSEAEGKKEGCILSVVGYGYTFRGRVIKPVLVEVARQIDRMQAGSAEGSKVASSLREQIEVGATTGEEGQTKSP